MATKVRKMLMILGTAGLCVAVSSCGPNVQKELAVGQLMGQENGTTYSVVKKDSNIGGYAVYENDKTGEYVAVKYDAYQTGMNYDQFIAAAGGQNVAVVRDLHEVDNSHYEWDATADYYYDDYGNIQYVGAYVWVNEIDYEGHGYSFEDGTPHLKDLETMGANLKAPQIAQLSSNFQSQYGLSADRAQEVANLVSSWSDLSKKREMTAADLKDFSSQVLGADLATFQKAYEKSVKSGDSKELDGLVQKAAKTNGISVEHARTILKGFLN